MVQEPATFLGLYLDHLVCSIDIHPVTDRRQGFSRFAPEENREHRAIARIEPETVCNAFRRGGNLHLIIAGRKSDKPELSVGIDPRGARLVRRQVAHFDRGALKRPSPLVNGGSGNLSAMVERTAVVLNVHVDRVSTRARIAHHLSPLHF